MKSPKIQIIIADPLKKIMVEEAGRRGLTLSTYAAHVLELHHCVPMTLIPDAKTSKEKWKNGLSRMKRIGGMLGRDG